MVSLGGLGHQEVQTVCIAQIGKEFLAVHGSARLPGCIPTQHAESLKTVQAKKYTTTSPTPKPTRSHSERDETSGTSESRGTSETNTVLVASADGELLKFHHQHSSLRIKTRMTVQCLTTLQRRLIPTRDTPRV